MLTLFIFNVLTWEPPGKRSHLLLVNLKIQKQHYGISAKSKNDD